MDKGGHYHVQLKRWMQKRALLCGNQAGWTEGIIISKLKGLMDKLEHIEVEMKWWMQKGAL